MAISMNKHTIIGRLGNDPDPIPNTDGVKLSVATSETWKDRDSGERKERTTWHKVVIWARPSADFAKRYVKKGDLVCIEGSVETRSWEKDGATNYITETVIRPFSGNIQAISKDGGSGRSNDSDTDRRDNDDRSGGYGSSSSSSGGSSGNFSRDMDDDIPF